MAPCNTRNDDVRLTLHRREVVQRLPDSEYRRVTLAAIRLRLASMAQVRSKVVAIRTRYE